MKNLRMDRFVAIGVMVSAILAAMVSSVRGVPLQHPFEFAVNVLPDVVTLDILLWSGFSATGWKWRLFHGWLVTVPIVEGSWKGQLKSTWEDGSGRTVPPVEVTAEIHQTFNSIGVVIRTEESYSRTVAADLVLDARNETWRFIYSYQNDPHLEIRERSGIHYGTACLRIEGPSVMRGEYWTDRGTAGSITLASR